MNNRKREKKLILLEEAVRFFGYSKHKILYLETSGDIKIYKDKSVVFVDFHSLNDYANKHNEPHKMKTAMEDSDKKKLFATFHDIIPPVRKDVQLIRKNVTRKVKNTQKKISLWTRATLLLLRTSKYGLVILAFMVIFTGGLFSSAFPAETELIEIYPTIYEGSWHNADNSFARDLSGDADLLDFGSENSATINKEKIEMDRVDVDFSDFSVDESFPVQSVNEQVDSGNDGESVYEDQDLDFIEKQNIGDALRIISEEAGSDTENGELEKKEVIMEENSALESDVGESESTELKNEEVSFFSQTKKLFSVLNARAEDGIEDKKNITTDHEENFEDTVGIIIPDLEGNLPFKKYNELDESRVERQVKIFTKQKSVVYSGFNFPARQDEISKVELGISLASYGDLDQKDEMIIEWSINGEDWNTAYELLQNKNYSNKDNEGYFFANIFSPGGYSSSENFENLRVRFTSFGYDDDWNNVFLDALWLEVEYVIDRNKRENELLVVSSKKNFKADDKPKLVFKYEKKDQGVLLSALDVLANPDKNYWNDIKVTTKILDENGRDADLISETVLEADGNIFLNIKKRRQFRPGVYKAVIEIEDNSQQIFGSLTARASETQKIEEDFVWGVLTINTNKSIYSPGELVYLQMGVLDERGHTLCHASLELRIRNTESGKETIFSTENEIRKIEYSGKCNGDNVTDAPDYHTYYQIEEIGVYETRLRNLDNGYEIIDSFEVRNNVPFDVERKGPTRIYPKASYDMVLRINVREDYQGLVKEIVPAGFIIVQEEIRILKFDEEDYEVYDLKYEVIENSNGEKELFWSGADLKIGDELEIKYKFDAPNISPYIYLLGPLQIGNFQEARKWQVASDAITGVKTAGTDSGTNWTGTSNTAVNDGSNYAVYSNTAQDYLILSNFGFTTADIPAGSYISGITVTRDGNGDGNAAKRDYMMALTKNASTIVGTEKVDLLLPKTTDDTVDIGSGTDLWGTTWVEGDIVGNANFGVMIRDNDAGASGLNFDYIAVKITYSNHTIVQEDFKIYQNSDTLKPTTAYSASENIRIGTIATNDVIRIRMNFSVDGENLAQNDHGFKLQFASAGTGMAPTCSSASGWADVGAISSTVDAWRGYDNTGVTDGVDLSVDPPTGGDLLLASSTVAGDYLEANSSPTNPFEITTTDYAEYDWVVQNYSATAGTNYCFRMVESDDSLFETYANYPNVATKNVIGSGYEQHQWASVSTTEVVLSGEDQTILDVWTNDTVLMRLMFKDDGDITGATVKMKFYYSYADIAADTNGVYVQPAGTAIPENGEYWEWFDASGCTSNWCDHGNSVITVRTSDHGPWVGKSFEQEISQGDSYLYDSNSSGSSTGPEDNLSLKYIGTETETDYYFRLFIDDQSLAISAMHYGTNKNAMVSTYAAADVSAVPVITMPITDQDIDSLVKVSGTGVSGAAVYIEVHDHFNPSPVIGTGSATVAGDGTWSDDVTYTAPASGTSLWVHAWQTESGKPASSPAEVNVYQRENYTLAQSTYRWFNNADSTDVGSVLAAQDTNVTLGSGGANFRLRLGGHVGTANVSASRLALKLQFAQQSGTCDTSYTGETWSDVTASTLIAFADNTTPADGTALTDNSNDPVHPTSHTNTNQTYEELNNFSNSAGITAGDDGLWDFSLVDNGAPANTSYCFRMLRTDDTVIAAPVVVPEIKTFAGITVSGNAYEDEATTTWTGCDGTTTNVSLVVGGGTVTKTSCNASSGAYAFSNINVSLDDLVSVFFNTDGSNTDEGVAITVAGDGTSNITLNPRKDVVWLKTEGGVADLTNSDLNHCDSDSPAGCASVPYAVDGSSILTLESATKLVVETGKTFAPGANVNAPALRVAGTYTGGSSTLTLNSSGTNVTCTTAVGTMIPLCLDGGVFTAGTSTIKYTGTSATTISSVTYNNLELIPVGTPTYTLASGVLTANGYLTAGNGTNAVIVNADTNDPTLDVLGNLTIATGASFTSSATGAFTVGGNWSNSGTFTHSGGTVIFDDTAGGKTLTGTMTGASSFNNLTFNGSGGGWSFGASSATIANNFTITNGSVTAPSTTLLVGGDFINNGTFTHNNGTVSFNDSSKTSQLTYSASTTFYGLTSTTGGKVIQFDETTAVQTIVTNTLTLTGSDCATGRIFLDSMVNDDLWEIVATGATVTIDSVDLEDSNAITTALTANNSTADNNNNTNWTVNAGTCAGGLTVAGISDKVSGTVKVAVNGSLQGQTGTIAGDGTWSISAVSISAGDIVTVWVDAVADSAESTAVTKYDGTGGIANMVLNNNVFSIGSDDTSVSVTVVDLGQYDCVDNEDVMHNASTIATLLEVEGVGGVCANSYTSEKIDILAGDVLTVGTAETLSTHDVTVSGTLTSSGSSTYNVSGSWDNNGTFTASNSTVNFTATSGTETLDSGGIGAGKLFNSVIHSGASILQLSTNAIDVDGNFSQTAGTFDVNGLNQNFAGNFSLSSGTIYTKGGTITFDGTTAYADSTATPQNIGTVVMSGTSVTLASSMTADKVSVSAGTIDLSSAGYTLTLIGSGTAGSRPFIVSGTLIEGTNSIVKYTGTSATEIEDETYFNLELVPAGTPVYTLGTAVSQTLTVSGYLTVGDATNAVTVNVDTYDPTLVVLGDFTITAAGSFTSSPTATFSVGGNWSNSATGVFTHTSGTVIFDDTTGGKTIDDGGDPFYDLIFNGIGGDWLYQDGTSVAPNQTTVQNGTVTYLNTKTGTVSVTGGTLNVDWYLGVHIVDRTIPATDIDTAVADIIVSENSGSPQSTVFRHNGTIWGAGVIAQTTDTDSVGENPQPSSDGAIRIREYSMTASASCPGAGCSVYKYNLQIDWQSAYGQYDYYDDYGLRYLTTCWEGSTIACSDDGTNDDVIGPLWHRAIPATIPTDGTLNDPSINGSWYVGMLNGLSFSIDSFSVDLGNIEPGAAPTDGTNTLTVTTSATNGYVINAWTSAVMTCSDAGACGTESITDWTGTNTTPTSWTNGSSYFGYSTNDSALLSGTADRFTNGGAKYAGFVHAGPGDVVADRSATQCPCTDQVNIITYRLESSLIQRPGPYQTTVVYIVTSNY